MVTLVAGSHDVRGQGKVTCFDPDEMALEFYPRWDTDFKCSPYKYYDDGYGPIWVYRDAGGLTAFVRAQTWEDAWSCVEDEILPPVSDAEELAEIEEHSKRHDGELPDGYSYQGNATGSGIVAHDLNGETLELLTSEFIDQFDLVIRVTL